MFEYKKSLLSVLTIENNRRHIISSMRRQTLSLKAAAYLLKSNVKRFSKMKIVREQHTYIVSIDLQQSVVLEACSSLSSENLCSGIAIKNFDQVFNCFRAILSETVTN